MVSLYNGLKPINKYRRESHGNRLLCHNRKGWFMSDEIYVDPSINAPVIKVSGECYQKVGGVPVAPNVSSVQGAFDDCGDCEGGCTMSPSEIALASGVSGSGSTKVCGLAPNTTYNLSTSGTCTSITLPTQITTDSSGCATITFTSSSTSQTGDVCTIGVVGASCTTQVVFGGCSNPASNNHPSATVTFTFNAPPPSDASCTPSSSGYGCACTSTYDGQCTVSGKTPSQGCYSGAELIWCPPTGTFTLTSTENPWQASSGYFSGATYSPSCGDTYPPCGSPTWTTGSTSDLVSASCYTCTSGGTYQSMFGLNPGQIYYLIKGGNFRCPCGWASGDGNGIWIGFAVTTIGSGGYVLAPQPQTVTMLAVKNNYTALSSGCPSVTLDIT